MRATLHNFAKNLDVTDLRWMPEEGFSVGRLRIDLLSGLTVALALVPEAVAFAFVAGVHPLVGLYPAFLVGPIPAVIGGRPGQVAGRAGGVGGGGTGAGRAREEEVVWGGDWAGSEAKGWGRIRPRSTEIAHESRR